MARKLPEIHPEYAEWKREAELLRSVASTGYYKDGIWVRPLPMAHPDADRLKAFETRIRDIENAAYGQINEMINAQKALCDQKGYTFHIAELDKLIGNTKGPRSR